MNVMKHSLMGLTAAAVLGMSGLVLAAPNDTQQARPQITEQHRAAFAQKHFERRYGNLNLSQAQQTKIKAIEAQYRIERPKAQATDAQHQAMKSNWEQLRQQRLSLVQSKTFDANKAEQLLSQENTLRTQMQTGHEQMRNERAMNQLRKEHAIYQVLDKKQQQQYVAQANSPRHMMARGGKAGKAKHHGMKQITPSTAAPAAN